MKILVVEDDQSLAYLVKTALENQHYLVDLAANGLLGLQLTEVNQYDLILLDMMLPLMNGIEFCRQVRQRGLSTPIMLMTAVDHTETKIAGFNAGADDYLLKPFNLAELLARILALLRRKPEVVAPLLIWGDISLDPSTCQVQYHHNILHLTVKEYHLLELFLRNPQRIYSQSAILDHLWSLDDPPSESAVRTHIKSLRQKLKQAGANSDLIETVYGFGYRLKSLDTAPKCALTNNPTASADQIVNQTIKNHQNNYQNNYQDQYQKSSLAQIWQRYQQTYLDRLQVIEATLEQMQHGLFFSTQTQLAKQEAHTLAGSLGSFGLVRASELAKRIETILTDLIQPLGNELTLLQNLVHELHQELSTSYHINDQPTAEIVNSTSEVSMVGDPLASLTKVLIVDDDRGLINILATEINSWGLSVQSATSIAQARNMIAQAYPDIVLLDLNFNNAKDNGLQFLTELTHSSPPVPVLVLTSESSFDVRIKVANLGGQGFLHKPINNQMLKEAIRKVLNKNIPPAGNILVVDDDPGLLQLVNTLLQPWGFDVILLDNPEQLGEVITETSTGIARKSIDLLILDVEMPKIKGLDLCRVLRNEAQWDDIPIIVLSAHTDAATIEQVFLAGADDYVTKPVIGPELIARVLNRLDRTQILRRLRQIGSE
ncbi:MAG: response regulator [Microcoleaceae cyanobacterium]